MFPVLLVFVAAGVHVEPPHDAAHFELVARNAVTRLKGLCEAVPHKGELVTSEDSLRNGSRDSRRQDFPR